MKYLSVCSGVEAASQAWMPLGWQAVAFSEIEPFPCAVLASRFPDVPNLGDMSKIHYNKETHELYNDTTRIVCNGGIDLLVGGTPCQSFSVAGKRAGLEGASGLAYHYARLIGEIQPRWFVWENVPGALSSVTYGDQRDFNFLLQQIGIGGNADLGVRYNLCWRVLDTQYVRVEQFPRAIPQRRRRVFVVGHLAADCRGGCEVLLEPEGVRGNPPPRRVKGQGAARDIEKGAGGADGAVGVVHGSMDPISNPCECANTIDRNYGMENCVALSFDPAPREVLKRQFVECSTTMQNGTCPGHHNAVAIRTANTHANGCGVAVEASHTMDGANGQAVAVGIDPYNSASTGEVSKTLNTAVAQDTDHTGAVAIGIGRDAFNSGKDCLVQQYHYAVRRITPIEGERLQGFKDGWTRPCFRAEDVTDALVDRYVAIHHQWAAINGKPNAKPKSREWVRKWLTKISSADCPDVPRYKAIGNSMSTNVMNWIGQRIQMEEN